MSENNRTYQDAISEIKDKLDVVETVSEHVILKKSGASYWGLCPFHKEKSPSFSVNPQRQIYKCFGCGEGGDSISFLMKVLNKNFNEVIKDLAEKFNIDLPQTYGNSQEHKDKKEKIIDVLKKTAEYYTENLLSHEEAKPALEYLKNRGMDESIIKEYKLGYALKSYDKLQLHLDKDFEKDIQEAAGLIVKREKEVGYIDRFRHRITIPIFDEKGDIVAFGARALADNQNPKYLNSPDSVVYNKSKILYGLYQAKEEIQKQDSIIIMEGYFDVISTQANGIKNCVASCGTSLTSEHIKIISRYTASRKIYLAFDADSAGHKATERGAELIKDSLGLLGDVKQFDESYLSVNDDKYACEIRVVTPPDGKDPDEFIQEKGIEAYREYIKKAPLLLDFKINELLGEKTNGMSATDKVKLAKKIIPLLLEIKNNISRNEYIKLVAQNLEIDEKALTNEVRTLGSNIISSVDRNPRPIVKKNFNLLQNTQKNLLSLYLIYEQPLNFEELKTLMRPINFDDEMLKNVKCTIDKLTCTVNNVGDLLQGLYTEFAEDNDTKDIVTDLIYLSDTFKTLTKDELKILISEQIDNIEKYKQNSKQSEIKAQYAKIKDDDEKARLVQMQLKEQLENKLKTGDI